MNFTIDTNERRALVGDGPHCEEARMKGVRGGRGHDGADALTEGRASGTGATKNEHRLSLRYHTIEIHDEGPSGARLPAWTASAVSERCAAFESVRGLPVNFFAKPKKSNALKQSVSSKPSEGPK